MNKWYRLGQEFAKKFDDKNVYDYLKKNNLCNNFTDSQGKDFKEKDYKKLCEMVGIPEEAEDKHYSHGERKYYFNWGFDKEKYYLIDWDGHPTSGAIDYALREGYQLFTWKYTKEIKDEDMYYVRIDPYIEEHLQSYSQTVKKSLFRHSGF